MSDNLIIKIDGDVSHLEKELSNAAGTGVRAFKRFGDGANGQLDRMQDSAEGLRDKLVEVGEDGEEAMENVGNAGKRALNDVQNAAKNSGKSAGKSMEDAASRAEKAWSKVMGVIKGIAGAAVVREIVKIGKEAVGLASDLTEVQNVVDVTFGEGNEKIEKFAKGAARQFGISELSAKKMAGTMGAMLKSMDVKNVDDMSISLVGLAADMGSFYNLDAEEAFAKLRSGISGETEPLKQLGINMSAANLEAFALASGMKKAYKDMSAAEQATLRYNYIMQATADAQGDFTRTSDSMANQLKIAKLNIENVKTSIGQALLPTATAATKAFNNLITNLTAGFPAMKESVKNAVTNIGAELDRLGITSRLKALMANVKLTLNQIIGFVVNIVQSLAKSPVIGELKNALSGVFDAFLGMWDKIGVLLSTLGAYLEPIWEGLKAGAQGFADAFLNVRTTVYNAVKFMFNAISSILDLVIGILTLDKDRIIAGAKGLWESLKGIFLTVSQGLGAVLNSMWQGIKDFWEKVKEKTRKKIKEIDLKKNGEELLESLKTGINTGWEAVKNWFSEKKEEALAKLGEIDLGEIGRKIVESLKTGFEEKWNEFMGWVGKLVDDFVDLLPDKLKEMLGIDVSAASGEPSAHSSGGGSGGPVASHRHGGGELSGTNSAAVQNASETITDAANAIEDAAEALDGAAKTIMKPNQPKPGAFGGGFPGMGNNRFSPVSPEMQELMNANIAAAEASKEAAESLPGAVADEMGESLPDAVGAALDDGVDFSFNGDALNDLDGLLEKNLPEDNADPDYFQMIADDAKSWIDKLFGDQTKTLDDDLNGIDSHVVSGFEGANGGGSEYSLLDEYNELMDLWSSNKDANGEWIADWSEGGIGQTLADLIQGKMPGKYWADLTEEDKRRMAGMTASDGYTEGQYVTQFRPEVTEPVEIPADLNIVSIEGSEEGDVLDFGALSEAVSDDVIDSWTNLGTALQTVMSVLKGEGEEGGLTTALSSIKTLLTDSVDGLGSFSDTLTSTIPGAVTTALQSLGEVSIDDDGNVTPTGKGNTLYTSLGAIKGVMEDINVAMDVFSNWLKSGIANAFRTFLNTAGGIEDSIASIKTAALEASDAFSRWAGNIQAVIGLLGKLKEATGGGSGTGKGSGIPEFAAAHGGLVNGVGVVGERGAEIISTSRNMNVFTNRALEIARARVGNMLARESVGYGLNSTSISNDNSRSTTVNVGTILGEDWLDQTINRKIRKTVERELFYAR